MPTTARLLVSIVVACSALTVTACSSAPSPDEQAPADTSATPRANVTQADGAFVVSNGTDEVVAKKQGDERIVAYYENGEWVGTVSFRAADRHMTFLAPGLVREGVLPVDLGTLGADPSGRGALSVALGMSDGDWTGPLARLVAVDARLAGNPDVSRAIDAFHARASAGGIQPKMWGICSSASGALACALLTAGICGYLMIYDCLVP